MKFLRNSEKSDWHLLQYMGPGCKSMTSIPLALCQVPKLDFHSSVRTTCFGDTIADAWLMRKSEFVIQAPFLNSSTIEFRQLNAGCMQRSDHKGKKISKSHNYLGKICELESLRRAVI